ncbi:MAG: PilZ domain-containing protein [Planctomycetota bacterium]
MSQPPEAYQERRLEPRHPAAFAFWFSAADDRQRTGAWMLNYSSSGAAFLTATEAAPVLGDRIRLQEMYSRDRMVREGNPALPAFARVVRLDETPGVTQRVAVRFEAEVPDQINERELRRSVAACPESQHPAAPPPPLSAGDPDSSVYMAAVRV